MLSSTRTRFRLLWLVPLRYAHVCKASSVRTLSTPRNGLLWLGIGASAIFALHEMSVINNDADRTTQTRFKSTEKIPLHTFEGASRQQDILAPDWTDNGIYRVDVASLAANTPSEDHFAFYTTAFSSTLRYLFFGVFDGHNGGSTARRLAADLPQLVCLYLADLYSKYASMSQEKVVKDAHSEQRPPPCKPGAPPDPHPPTHDIHAVVKAAFLELDHSMVHEAARKALGLSEEEFHTLNARTELAESNKGSHPASRTKHLEAMKTLAESYAGSCAILAIYNSFKRILHVALTGDLRAVLGRRVLASNTNEQSKTESSPSGNDEPRYVYEVHQLSIDQNAKNPKEAERLTVLHPDEPELLKKDRVLGWGPSRAFGDGVMKWSLAVQHRLWEECLGDWPRTELCKTPPYFSAEPEVTTFEGVKRGDFLVLASDGLWDSLTNEEVVGLVGRWLEERGSKENIAVEGEEKEVEVMLPKKVYPRSTIAPSSLHMGLRKQQDSDEGQSVKTKGSSETFGPSDLPVAYPDGYKDNTVMYKYWRIEKRFASASEDESNAAKYLIRNALGGADNELSEALYMMEGSRRRRFRDDITVQVIFFE